jgi:ribonuclease HI
MKSIILFTDGSCIGNGKVKSFGGIGIYFPNKELKNISFIYPFKSCTNQKTELLAIYMAIKYLYNNNLMEHKKICIVTDSNYSINCITKWTKSWKKNNWITTSGHEVKNKKIINKIYNYYQKYDIQLKHIKAHTQKQDFYSKGNDKADKLATMASERAKKNDK